jgi:HEAT repeat protein
MNKTIQLIALLAATVAVAASASLPALAGRGAHRAEVAGAVRTGNADAIIAVLEKAENMPATAATVTLIEGLLADDDYRIREVAAWWFARRAAHKTRLAAAGFEALGAADSVAARNAADMLGTFRHPQAVAALSAAAIRGDLSAEARAASVRALGTIGHPAGADALAAAMSDPDAAVRLQAALAWAEIRRQDHAVPVAALVGDADVSVRRVAARVAGKYREASARAALETALASDADTLVRRNAAFALGRIGDPGSRDALRLAADTDESVMVRAYARRALSAR